MNVELTPEELKLLTDALDSHRYWQLSDPHYRCEGVVHGKMSDDGENRQAIYAVNKLEAKLEALR